MNYTTMELRNIAKTLTAENIELTKGMESAEIRDYLLNHRVLTSFNGMLCDAEIDQVRDFYYEAKGDFGEVKENVSNSYTNAGESGSFGFIAGAIAAVVLAIVGFIKNENRRYIFPVASILLLIAKALEFAFSSDANIEDHSFTFVAGIICLVIATALAHVFGENDDNFIRKHSGKEKNYFGKAFIFFMVCLAVAMYMSYDFISWGSEYQVMPSFVMLCIIFGCTLVSSILSKKNLQLSRVILFGGLSLMVFLDYDGLTFYDYEEYADSAMSIMKVLILCALVLALLFIVTAGSNFAKVSGILFDIVVAALIITTAFNYEMALVIIAPMVIGLYQTMYLARGIVDNEARRQRDIEAGYIAA